MLRKHRRKPSRLPQILVISGLALVILTIFAFKEKPKAESPSTGSTDPAEVQLDTALEKSLPTFAFFHANNCQQCILMMEIVAQVYPDFEKDVTLVDINVYDEENQPLLQRVRLQYIPTLIFYDQNGQSTTHVGVMEAAQLSDTLAALAGGK
ncbi:MAG: thioredoxin [Chloroflexi bacterium]|nr:MAG: thioredoxin [Chloroflexota bacterium]